MFQTHQHIIFGGFHPPYRRYPWRKSPRRTGPGSTTPPTASKRAWKTGPRPLIENYLAEVEESRWPRLLEELLRVEGELRRRDGEKPSPEDYSLRFSQHAALIEAIFGPEPDQSDATGPRPDPSTTAVVTPGGDRNGDGEPSPAPGTLVSYFGDYELIEELGRGGMGIVYEARQISLNRPVALKMIRAGLLADGDELRRFQNEAEVVAALDHPHLVPIYEVGEHDGKRYFSMKLIGGSPLNEALDRYTADPRSAVGPMIAVAEAVHHAHQRGILHRDLKPSNILLDERSQPHVTDFGLAKRVGREGEQTVSGAILGTPAYMAPEQASGRKRQVTTLSDVYGLGAVLYALLTGKAPFGGETHLETLDQVRHQPPVAPSRINPRAPHDLEVICLKCLEKDPARRYASAQVLADDLRRYRNGEPIMARPTCVLERGWLWCRRNPKLAAVTALLAAVIAIGSGVFTALAIVARNQAEVAWTQTGIAKAQTELALRRLYDVQMIQVQRYWEDWNPHLFLEVLEEQRPENQEGKDRRGFEWYYWQQRLLNEQVSLPRQKRAVNGSFEISSDGSRIATTSYGTLKIWDTKTGKELLSYKPDGQEVMGLAFSPDGTRFATVGTGDTEKVWDAATCKPLFDLPPSHARVDGVIFSPDSLRLAYVNDHKVKVWDTRGARELLEFEDQDAGSFLPLGTDGFRLCTVPDRYFGSSSEKPINVKIWDAAKGREIVRLDGQFTKWSFVIASRDGRRIATYTQEFLVQIWDAASGREVLSLKHKSLVAHPIWTGQALVPGGIWMALNHDGTRLATWNEGPLQVWDTMTGTQLFDLRGAITVGLSFSFSPDGSRILYTDKNGLVAALDVTGSQGASTGKTRDCYD